MALRLGVSGYRNFNDYECFKTHMESLIAIKGEPSEIISGGCKGTDKMAERFAKEKGYPMIVLKPDFAKYKGNSAFAARDKQIVEQCTHLIAFLHPLSKGTKLTIQFALDCKREMTVINVV